MHDQRHALRAPKVFHGAVRTVSWDREGRRDNSTTGPGLPEGVAHVCRRTWASWRKLRTLLSGTEQGYDCARQTMLNLLSVVKGELGDLDKVKRVVKLLCMINATPDFGDTPKVANGASDLLNSIYGEKGRHARSAVGMATLPSGMPVEIEMIL